MKIFILYAEENWIVDQLANEWILHNKENYTKDFRKADLIWILSSYICDSIPINIYKNKKVITTIHHIVPEKTDKNKIKHFKYLDTFTDLFLTFTNECKETLSNYVSNEIIIKKQWVNQNLYFNIPEKNALRDRFNIDTNTFLVGSFQRDTEGNSLKSKRFKPKLEKGPDIFIEVIKKLKIKKPNVRVLLTGYRRQYIMRELNKINVPFYYFEMVPFSKLNELYNCLDLYIVSSRVEGGPRAILECSIAKIPIISTDVGIAKNILSEKSIFNYNKIEEIEVCEPDLEYAYQNAKSLTIPKHFIDFNEIFNI
jgi:glycosyltransferase involved in cell wall biosynthesis